MKKILLFLVIICLFLTGCQSTKPTLLYENLKKIELTGNLVTYEAYFHNVIEYEKDPGVGISHLFEKKRRLFAEYTGTIQYGINLSRVTIEVKGDTVFVFIPKATVIGEPNIEQDDFKPENFIESKDGLLNKNPISADDSTEAFDLAQQEMKENAAKDEELLSLAQKRAKVLLEENIRQFSGVSDKNYTIDWEYEQ